MPLPANDPERAAGLSFLPLHLKPKAGEALAGYLVRLAGAYGYGSPRSFWDAAIRKYGALPGGICQALHFTPEDEERLTGPQLWRASLSARMPAGLERADFCLTAMRWCPECMKSSEYLRFTWTIKYICVCPIHRTILLDRCPGCGQIQVFQRASLTTCHCGYNLVRAGTQSADATLSRIQEAFAAAVIGETSEKSLRFALSEWRLLFHFAAVVAASDRTRRTGQPAGLQRVDVAVALMRQLSELLDDWPAGFHRMLASKHAEKNPSSSIARTFGRTYRWLYVELGGSAFQFLRDAFELYIENYWRGVVCRRNRRLSVGSRRRHGQVTVREFARAAGTTEGMVKRLGLADNIDATTIALPSGRRAWSIARSETDKAKVLMADTINLWQAADFLGLSRRRVRELVASQLIRDRSPRLGNKAAAWMFSRAELNDLVERCVAKAQCCTGGPTVPLRVFLKSGRLVAGELSALIDTMLCGELQCIRVDGLSRRLGDIQLPRVALDNWRQRWRVDHAAELSIAQAAKVLGIKQEVAYHLVRKQLIASEPATGDCTIRRISVKALSDFRSRYVSLTEISSTRGQSTRAVLRDLSARPVVGPMIDGGRQYFYLRSELSGELPLEIC